MSNLWQSALHRTPPLNQMKETSPRQSAFLQLRDFLGLQAKSVAVESVSVIECSSRHYEVDMCQFTDQTCLCMAVHYGDDILNWFEKPIGTWIIHSESNRPMF